MEHPGSNRWWIQEGLDYWMDETSTPYVLGFGYQTKYLGVELNYSGGQEFNLQSLYIVNEYAAYEPTAKNYCKHPDPQECRTSSGYQHGEVYMFNLSLLPRYPITDDFAVFARLGASLKHAHMEHKHFDNRSNQERHTTTMWWTDRSIGAVVGAGIQYGNFTLEYNKYPSARVRITPYQSSGWQSTETYTINYRWAL